MFPAQTVQRTQYYPSGLPWKSNSGDNPGEQAYKYGEKEFVEMHGYDAYDSETRWYYPAIMRTTTIDPLAEKYYDVSPYAWCGNNPIIMIDPTGMDWYSYQEEYIDKNGKNKKRTAYKYVEGQMSKKEMKEGGYTHLGKTYTNGNQYYSLFGSKQDLRTKEGRAYQRIDQAIIQYADYKEENKHFTYNNGEEKGMPATDFSMNNNVTFNIEYEGSFFGVIRLSKQESNSAFMEDWVGNGDQPKSISGWTSSNERNYHIRFVTKSAKRNRDVLHLKYDNTNAMRLLRIYYNLFPELKPKSK